MSLFRRKKQIEEEKKVSEASGEQKKENATSPVLKELAVKNVLIRPVVTEKSNALAGLGKYVFLVTNDANKHLVKQNVEARYNVHVENVNIINIKGKVKYYMGRPYKKKDVKKAIVTLRKGEKIEIQ